MPAGRGRGKPRATPLRTGPGRAGPRGGRPGRPGARTRSEPPAKELGGEVRCGGSGRGTGSAPPLPLSCEAGSGRRSTRIGPALHRERRGRPALSGGPHPTSRRVPATLADSRRAREDPVPQRALPAGPHPGGGRRADGPRRSPGGGRRRAHPGPGERGRRAPPDLASGGPPGSRREEEPIRGAVPPREQTRQIYIYTEPGERRETGAGRERERGGREVRADREGESPGKPPGDAKKRPPECRRPDRETETPARTDGRAEK